MIARSVNNPIPAGAAARLRVRIKPSVSSVIQSLVGTPCRKFDARR